MGTRAGRRIVVGRPLAGLALGLSLAGHAAALGVAALLVAGPAWDPPERASEGSLRLDLRRSADRAADLAPLREPSTARGGIPGPVEPALEPSDPLDHEAWAEPDALADSIPTADAARAAFPDLDPIRGGRRVPRRVRGAGLAGGPAGAGAERSGLGTGMGTGAGTGDGAGGGGPGSGGSGDSPGGGRTSTPPDQAPRALVAPRPEYPATARLRGQQGTVRCRVHVRIDGAVERVEVLVSSGSAWLDEAAVEALSRWRYEPATRDGEPVAAAVDQEVRFGLVAPRR